MRPLLFCNGRQVRYSPPKTNKRICYINDDKKKGSEDPSTSFCVKVTRWSVDLDGASTLALFRAAAGCQAVPLVEMQKEKLP